jgi:hypothetical protein
LEIDAGLGFCLSYLSFGEVLVAVRINLLYLDEVICISYHIATLGLLSLLSAKPHYDTQVADCHCHLFWELGSPSGVKNYFDCSGSVVTCFPGQVSSCLLRLDRGNE